MLVSEWTLEFGSRGGDQAMKNRTKCVHPLDEGGKTIVSLHPRSTSYGSRFVRSRCRRAAASASRLSETAPGRDDRVLDTRARSPRLEGELARTLARIAEVAAPASTSRWRRIRVPPSRPRAGQGVGGSSLRTRRTLRRRWPALPMLAAQESNRCGPRPSSSSTPPATRSRNERGREEEAPLRRSRPTAIEQS